MYYIVISLIDDSGEILCLCLRVWFVIVVLFGFCVYPGGWKWCWPPCIYVQCSSSLGSLVMSGMCFAVELFDC